MPKLGFKSVEEKFTSAAPSPDGQLNIDADIIKAQFKVVLLGDGTVGKSSIALRFAEDQFTKNYKQTVGCDFFIRRLDVPPQHHVSLQVWDIGGQSINSKMISKYIAGANAVLLCYDVTNYESFANLEDWYRIVLRTFKGSKLPFTVLVGNKNDLRHSSTVHVQQHNMFADENEMASFLISAKSGDQVRQAFWKVAATLVGLPVMKIKAEDMTSSVIPATIVDHQRHDERVAEGKVPDYTKEDNGSVCCIS